MGLMRDIIKRLIFTKDELEEMNPRNLTQAQEDYEYLTGEKFVGLNRSLSAKQKKDVRNEMDEYMKEKGYRPMYRRTKQIKRKKKLKVGESEVIGKV